MNINDTYKIFRETLLNKDTFDEISKSLFKMKHINISKGKFNIVETSLLERTTIRLAMRLTYIVNHNYMEVLFFISFETLVTNVMDLEPGLENNKLDELNLATQIKIRIAYIIFRLYDKLKDKEIFPFIDNYKIDYEIIKAFPISQQIFDTELKLFY